MLISPFPLSLVVDDGTSEFGWRVHPITGLRTFHHGLDYAASAGDPIRAAADGTVIHAGYNGGEGISVHVRHADGVVTKYFHMSSLNAAQGDQVRQGDTLGYVGSTGNSTGNHLHFEVWVNGQDVNPRDYFTEPSIITAIRKRRNMSKIIIGFEDTKALSLFDISNPTETRERYQGISNTDDLVLLEAIYGSRIWFPTQGAFDVLRTGYGLGNQVGPK